MSAIMDIFNEVQRSAQTHKLCVKKLAAAINVKGAQEQENLTYFLNGGIDRILLHPGSGAPMDRSVTFLGSFLAAVDERVLMLTMKHLCSRLQSSNKLVRQRICQIICSALTALCEAKIDLSEELFAELSTFMISRLKDKVPAVRIWAVKAMKFLQVPEDDEDPSMLELKRVMRSDSSTTVRVAAVEVLSLTDGSKHDLCARLKDVKSEVRVAVLNRLASETDMRQFTVQMRAEILRSALEDREEVVRLAVMALIWKWLSLVDTSNIPKFLNLLNPAENEEAALLVGATIMEELVKSEASQHAKMKRAVKDSFFKWNALAASGGASSLTPSDVLWVQIRCSYARQFLPVFPASEICDAVLPDAVALCTVLRDVKATLIVPSQHHTKQSSIVKAQFVVKYLLNLAPLLIGNTDISGLSQLLAECADTFLNTNVTLPWDCVESALRAHAELHVAAGSTVEAHRAVLEMATNLREEAARLAEPPAEGEIEVEAASPVPEVTQKLLLTITERCLQLTHWSLQQELSIMACRDNTASADDEQDPPASPFAAELPFILQGLQQPQYQLRFLAVGCLGLMCLVEPKLCDAYRGLILHIASGDFEDTSIRSQALQSLVDFSVVFPDKYKDDVDLGNVLLRMQESGEPEAMLVAAEAACKLLHSGTHHEPRLFANLLKFFFLTESLPEASPSGKLTPSTGNEEEDLRAAQEDFERRVFLANCARLQQILSIFFHVFTTTDVIADQVVAESIPYLVADMTNEIKDGTVEPVALSKILKHLFSLCENKVAAPAVAAAPAELDENGEEIVPVAAPTQASASCDAALATVRATTAAALSKELLKLGNSKLEKAIDKEYVKIFATLALETWIDNFDVASVERVVDTITVCSTHDRATNKNLELLMQICITLDMHMPNAGIKSATEFVHLAPGLTDLIELAARSSVLDQSVDEGASFCADDASLPGSAMKRAPRSATKARPPSIPSVSVAAAAAVGKARAPRARSTRARRPSYAEEDDQDSDLEEESESDSSVSSESENDDNDAEPAESFGEDVRNATMSPTKQFVLSSTGNTKKMTPSKKKKSTTVKKISFQDDE